MEKKKPRGRPFKKGQPRPANAGRKKGSGGKRVTLTIPLDIAESLPEQDKEARAVIVSAVREKIKGEQ